ncbi:MAG: hypothetical protein ABI779_11255 [Acidobacteriota bacterium]
MQRVFKGGAVVALIAILMAPTVYADDSSGSFDSSVRILPPGGVAAQEEPPTVFELFWVWLQARIGPPTG